MKRKKKEVVKKVAKKVVKKVAKRVLAKKKETTRVGASKAAPVASKSRVFLQELQESILALRGSIKALTYVVQDLTKAWSSKDLPIVDALSVGEVVDWAEVGSLPEGVSEDLTFRHECPGNIPVNS